MSHRSTTLTVLCLGLAVLLLTTCDRAPPGGQVVQADVARAAPAGLPDAALAQLVAGNHAFAFDLYHAIATQYEENLILSPYSISLVFSMIYAGAKGDAEAEMAQVFHFLPQEAQHAAFNAVDGRLQSLGKRPLGEQEVPFQLSLVNAAWGQRGTAFRQAYLETLAAQYGAGLRVVDFAGAPEEAREAINAWVSEATGQRIAEIAPPGSVSEQTRLVLADAITFKAGWYHPFKPSDTADGAFTLLDGSEVTVPLMGQEMRLEYAEGDSYQAVRLPYAGEEVDMWVILPAEGRFEAVQARWQASLSEARQAANSWQVTLTLPRFRFGGELLLHELLPAMGMASAFCPASDFEGMVEGGGLCVGYALQRATIAVDETGTEAAAATMGAIQVSQMEDVTMRVERPFLFAIVVRGKGEILFLGRVLNPALG